MSIFEVVAIFRKVKAMDSPTSFLTGSRVYGTPRADSDIDLVVLMSGDALCKLIEIAESQDSLGASGGEQYEDGRSLRFGKLNLLCVTQERHFNAWRIGTEELEHMKPVTRDFAIEHLAAIRRKAGIQGW
jgi:hypothetical protein